VRFKSQSQDSELWGAGNEDRIEGKSESRKSEQGVGDRSGSNPGLVAKIGSQNWEPGLGTRLGARKRVRNRCQD